MTAGARIPVGHRAEADSRSRAARRIPVGLSTSSVFPGSVEDTFALAARLGYDGVEVMVTAERASQDPEALADLMARYHLRILAIHAPSLIVTARVWGTEAVGKIERSVEMAEHLGARVVVSHPPLMGQPMAADSFPEAVAELSQRTDVAVTIENMFPLAVPVGAGLKAASWARLPAWAKIPSALVKPSWARLPSAVPLPGRRSVNLSPYRPHWNTIETGYPAYTLDLSHAASSGVDALEMARAMGDALAHVHLADGSGSARDEHLLPGDGIAPCAEVLDGLAAGDFGAAGVSVAVEVSTRAARKSERERDLARVLAFAHEHLGQQAG